MAACKPSTSVHPDPCADGHCDAEIFCELGACGDAAPNPGVATMTARRAPIDDRYDGVEPGTCPRERSRLPPLEVLVDDSDIPEFSRARGRKTNFLAGHEFLQDWQLEDHLMGVQGALFECLDLAACYGAGAASAGELEFRFELEPDGRVSAVSVRPSRELDRPIVRACARRSLYQARFPSWDGGRMVVDYSIAISWGHG